MDHHGDICSDAASGSSYDWNILGGSVLEGLIRPSYQRLFVDPVARLLARLPWVTPLRITLLSGLLGLLIVYFLVIDLPVLACLVMWFSGYLDTLDGTLARLTMGSSNYGAVLDILSDRWVEFCIVLGLYFVMPASRGLLSILMLGSILLCVTSFLVVGIFVENNSVKGFHYSAGLMERAEAFLFFTAMMLLPHVYTVLAILFVFLVLLTAGLRVSQYLQQERQRLREKELSNGC